jgi:hypothetical protein
MEMNAAQYPRGGYDFPISTLFVGAVIVVALVAACLLVGKAIESPRNRRRFDGRPVEGGHTEDPNGFGDKDVLDADRGLGPDDSRFEPSPFDRTVADLWYENDQTRGQRKAIKERRKAREKAQKRQNKT